MTLAWWMFVIAGLALGGGSALLAMLSLSAGTAYGTEYHVLTARQRVMARLLGTGALLAALVCGIAGFGLCAWGLRALWLGL